VGFGPGGIGTLAGAVWTTIQTVIAFALLGVVIGQLRAPSREEGAAAAPAQSVSL
jgi:hypothetical protein